MQTRLANTGHAITLVPIATVLMAGIRMTFLDVERGNGRHIFACHGDFHKGEEMGWFEHGSTVIVPAPGRFSLCDNVRDGAHIRVGEPLIRLP